MTTTSAPTAPGAAPLTPPPPRPRSGSRRIASDAGLVVAAVVIVLVAGWAFAPGLFTTHDPLMGVGADKLQPPGPAHVFGTDQLGRDLWSRVVHGAALSLSGALIAVALAVVLGSTFGLVAGYLGGWVDDTLMRLTDAVLAVPSILMSMAIITVLGRGSLVVAVAVGLAGVGGIARTMRSEVLKVKVSDYVEAARAGGARWWQIVVGHVLPNAWGPVAVLIVIEFGQALLAIAALSFLGYGEPPPSPEWGALVSGGRDYIGTAWWLITLPGLVIVAVVLSVNRVSQQLQTWSRKRAGR